MPETTTLDPTTTGSRKIDALVAYARELGLVVAVKVVDQVYAWNTDGAVHRLVDVVITRPRVDVPETALDGSTTPSGSTRSGVGRASMAGPRSWSCAASPA
jgi:hypothetical protein